MVTRNQNEDASKNAKSALIAAVYAGKAMKCNGIIDSMGSCDCNNCKIVETTETCAIVVYTAAVEASVGKPAMLEEVINTLNEITKKYLPSSK